MSGWECLSCGWLGTEPDLRRELDKIDEGAARYVVVQLCQDCGGEEDLVEIPMCAYCQDCGVDSKALFDDMCREHAIENDWDFNTKRDQVAEIQPLIRRQA